MPGSKNKYKNLDLYFESYLGMLYDIEVKKEILHKASLTVCRYADDVADASFLMDVLGLKSALAINQDTI